MLFPPQELERLLSGHVAELMPSGHAVQSRREMDAVPELPEVAR